MAAGSWQLIWVAGNTGSGTVTLASLPQTGATSGQVIAWNGSSWAPATVAGGGGGGGTGTINSLSGDVTSGTVSGTGNAPTSVAYVGGWSATGIANICQTVTGMSSSASPSTLMFRDNNGQVAATTFTGALSGNATTATTATTATNYIGTVALSQLSAGGAASGQVLAYNGTAWAAYTLPTYTPGITQLNGDVTTPASSSGNAAATVAQVGGKTAAAVASSVTTVSAATSSSTASTLVMRDSSGNFSAGTITASLSGNATSATTATSATNYTGSVTLSQLAQGSATNGQVISWNGTAWVAATVASGGSGITQLTGDVTTAAGSSGSTAASVAYVGGSSASAVNAAATAVANMTANTTANVLAFRDSGAAIGRGTGIQPASSNTTISAAISGYTYYVTSGSPTLTLPVNPSSISLKYYIITNGSAVTLAPPSGGTLYYFSSSTTNSISTVNSYTAASIELTGIPGTSNYLLSNINGNWNNAGNPLNVYSALSYPATSGWVLTANGSSGGAAFAAPSGGSSAPVFAASIASPPASATGTIYVATSTITSTLPVSPATATQFTFINGASGAQTIAQGTGAQIYVGNTATTSGTGGSVLLSGQGAQLTVACAAGSNTWYKLGGSSGQVQTT